MENLIMINLLISLQATMKNSLSHLNIRILINKKTPKFYAIKNFCFISKRISLTYCEYYQYKSIQLYQMFFKAYDLLCQIWFEELPMMRNSSPSFYRIKLIEPIHLIFNAKQ